MKALLTALMTALVVLIATTAPAGEFTSPTPVVIEGYQDHAMEPFLTRDDRILMFNNSNAPGVDTDLHWAERVAADRFVYRGRIGGANSNQLDGVASMDHSGMFYFVTTRSYWRDQETLYRGRFAGGRITDLAIVRGISLRTPGHLNFDAEISQDGQTIYAVDGVFRGGPVPRSADLFIAHRRGDRFVRDPESSRIFRRINTGALEYAPATTADQLELFFTRLSGSLFARKLQIMHATRTSRDAAFSAPRVIGAITGFVEAPTLSRDGRTLYYHKKVDGLHRIYLVRR